MDCNLKSQGTVVCVHSPHLQFSPCGGYYTSYAVSLKSDNPCFTYSSSQTRRRYSEFLHLRKLLESHHTIITPPQLPPKRFFNRFGDIQIEERRQGLQKFLEKVLAVSLYLSDKSLHLFLQTSCSMSQIDQQCLGDIPIPELLEDEPLSKTCNSDSASSNNSGSEKKPVILLNRNRKVVNSILENEFDCNSSSPILIQQTSPSRNVTRTLNIPKGSVDSSPCSSLSSLDAGYCSPTECLRSRKVSFNENVTVAVVYNHLWNIATEPIRTST